MRAAPGNSTISPLSQYWDLLWSLTWRDLRVRYKQSALGIAWAVLVPLSMMLVFTFVFTQAMDASLVLNVEMPYALYAYLGLVPWMFFSISLNNCVNSLVANRNLVTKVYFPREVFPLSCIASALVDFLVASTVLVGLVVYFHLRGRYSFAPSVALGFIPVIVIVQIALTAGVGMILAMGNLFFRDVRQIFTVAIQLWMFISAVVVPVPNDGTWLAHVIHLNPMVAIITAYRDCVVHSRLPETASFTYATLCSVGVLIIGWSWFRRASYLFAERI